MCSSTKPLSYIPGAGPQDQVLWDLIYKTHFIMHNICINHDICFHDGIVMKYYRLFRYTDIHRLCMRDHYCMATKSQGFKNSRIAQKLPQ